MGFHHNYQYLKPGDVIHAGNWGRLIQGYGAHHTLFLRETLWELVREFEFPQLPSRLRAAFFYDDEPTARRYWLEGDSPLVPNLYEVEVVDPSIPIHRADMELWEQSWLQAHLPQEAADVARLYWKGDAPSGRLESLTHSDLRVVGIVERARPR